MSHAKTAAPLPATSRRKLLIHGVCASAVLAGFATRPRAAERPLRIGSTLDLSGAEKANGTGLNIGASAYFAAVNAAGGVNGAHLELLTQDDQFKPDLAKANALAFEADRSVLAILHPLGTRQTAAVMEAVPAMAVIGPNTGTVGLRKKAAPNTFWVRANYDQEIDKLIETAATLGTTTIGLVHPNDPLGQSLLAAFNASVARHKLTPVVIATTPGTTSPEVGPAA
jgi:ABC-type branched-subunit amino acid transport system substrate-binding protein